MADASDAGACRNCGTILQGDYCHHCGQRESSRDYRFTDLAGELVGDLFVWDSRFWRTLLPLLFRPGFLTAEFIAGRKARYMPPLRLYLVVSFAMFLLLSAFALLVQCCYLRSGFHYLQHLVFSLHFHSALFLVLAVTLALGPLISYELGNWALLYAAVSMPVALVRTYGSGYPGAVARSLLIGLLDLVLLLLCVTALVVGSLVTL